MTNCACDAHVKWVQALPSDRKSGANRRRKQGVALRRRRNTATFVPNSSHLFWDTTDRDRCKSANFVPGQYAGMQLPILGSRVEGVW